MREKLYFRISDPWNKFLGKALDRDCIQQPDKAANEPYIAHRFMEKSLQLNLLLLWRIDGNTGHR